MKSTWEAPYKFNGKPACRSTGHRVAGREKDEETGLYYYGARYYSPELSIWASVDPLADKYPSLSSYAYCANNPIVFIDPNGMYVEYDKFRDRVNTFIARVFNKGFNQRFNEWKNSPNTYTIGLRPNHPRLIDAQAKWSPPLNTDQYQVHYSLAGSGGERGNMVNINWALTIPRSIDANNQPSENIKTYNLKNVDVNSPVTFAPYGHPDNINVTDGIGTSILNGSFVASNNNNWLATNSTNGNTLPAPSILTTQGATNSQGSACINIPASTQMNFSIQSSNVWPRVNTSPSRESTSHYRIEWRQIVIKINFNL